MVKLRIAFVVFVTLLTSLSATSQTKPQQRHDNPKVADWGGGYFGLLYLIDDSNNRFADIDHIVVDYVGNQENDDNELAPDAHGHIPTAGKLLTKHGLTYPFSQSVLTEGAREIKIAWTTNVVNGTHYSFEGTYRERPRELRKNHSIVGYVDLEGTLTKFSNGHSVARGKVGFDMFGIE